MISIGEAKAQSVDAELHWLVSEIITPEFPQLIEALQICSNLLLYNSPQHPDQDRHVERGPAITLPFSLGKSDEISGIVVRDGAYITKMVANLREKHMNRNVNRLSLRQPYLLAQVVTAKKSIDNAVELIVRATSIFDKEGERGDVKQKTDFCEPQHNLLVEVFQDLLKELQKAKASLQLPTDPALVFPQHVTEEAMFEPRLNSIAVDMYISLAEVCIDIKDLTRVVEKPWCEIDEGGKLYVDKLRDQMSCGADVTVEQDEKGVFLSVLGHLIKPRYDLQDYITRAVTYNNSVVIVNKKLEVLSADPVLVSAFTKLDSVEYMVSSFMENIRKLSRESD